MVSVGRDSFCQEPCSASTADISHWIEFSDDDHQERSMNSTSLFRQRGAVAILFCLSLGFMLGVTGLALDLAAVYHRKAELQALADAAALAAAGSLTGTADGVTLAVAQAADTAGKFRYQFDRLQVGWSGAALKFGRAPGAPESDWVDAAAALAAPAGLLYARVDTAALPDIGTVASNLMRLIPGAPSSTTMSARAVAGRASTNVLPLAICALSTTPASERANVAGNPAYNELVEYGFRRGVGYDLMQLNPNDATAENFLIDPMTPPGMPGSAGNLSAAVARPFVCAGSMPMASVMGGALTLKRGFPIAELFDSLNSRFDDYATNACTPAGAPPDANVKSYAPAGAGWMNVAPTLPAAGVWTSGGAKRWTRADPLPGDASNTAPLYGTLWSYARAVPYASYAATPLEPAAGYTGFAPAAWASLYTPAPPQAKASYPGSTPYQPISGANFLAPPDLSHRPGVRNRRVLNVALLSCPVAAGAVTSAPVLAVGRFFMTTSADAASISGEFAGIATPAALAGAVELQR
jgi:Flp pilus assembly protein TadG